jgi:hypothetical protein
MCVQTRKILHSALYEKPLDLKKVSLSVQPKLQQNAKVSIFLFYCDHLTYIMQSSDEVTEMKFTPHNIPHMSVCYKYLAVSLLLS